jgi:hypothetical protein
MNIRFPLYDFFGFLLPGVVALLAALLVVWSTYLTAVPLAFLSLPKQVWFLLVVLAYFAGHLVQAVGNVLSDLLWHPEERIFGEGADSSCKALVGEARSTIHGTLGVPQLSPKWTYRICDGAVVQLGSTVERDVFVYREGFYRGTGVAFGLLAVALFIRAIVGATYIAWDDASVAVPRTLLFGLTAAAAVACALMFRRFDRFAQHRVKSALIGFLLISKTKKSEVKNA